MLDPDIANPKSLGNEFLRQLTELGFHTLETSAPQAVADLASQGSIELVVCCRAEVLDNLPSLNPAVGLVLGSRELLDNAALINAMRRDVHDVWYAPQNSEHLSKRVESLQQRLARRISAVSGEVASMRTELERDQRAGQYIQMGMLPPNPMGIGHYRLQHRVQPSLLLSGDFVDYFQISERYFACYVADVAGHGASSAFITVLLKNFSRRLRREYRVAMLSNPGEVLQWINEELIDQGIEKHVAMFFAIMDTQEERLNYANAAHFPPAALLVDGQYKGLEQKAKPLGLFPGIKYQSLSADFPQGAKLVVFSDGILDLLSGGSIAAKEAALIETICASDDMETLWSSFQQDKIGPDDVSCLLVQYE